MSFKNKNRVCPVEKARSLDSFFRKIIQNPNKILKPYITAGMTILDFGCGPGFFSIEAAKLTGVKGAVYSVDLQEKMLDIVKKKIENTELKNIIRLSKCGESEIGVDAQVDFILMFYMFHELPKQEDTLKQKKTILKPNGKILIAEPKFHVSKKEFEKSKQLAVNSGFKIIAAPKIIFSRAAILTR